MKKLWIYLGMGGGGWVHYKIEYFVGSFLYILGLFKVKIWHGNIFWDRKIFFGYA